MGKKELGALSKTALFGCQKQLFGGCCWTQKSLIYVYIHANQGFRVSQTALKTIVFESQKEMFLSPKKA